MRKGICVYILFFLTCCTACEVPTPTENYRSITQERWDRDSSYKFKFPITQTGTYELSTCVRHTTDYKQRNLSCHVNISRPGTNDITMNTEVTLTDSEGSWVGQGSGGLKTVVQPSNQVLRLDSTGVYTVEIRHRMKEKILSGIKDIGIKIIKK